jgi:hypothetical protein
MPRLQELGLGNEQVGEALDYNTMPDQMGTFVEPPQPGTYRFKVPARMDDIWEAFDHTNGKPPGKRVRAKFDDAHPLLIVQSPGGTRDGEPFLTSVTNAERRRGKKDDTTAPFISDMDYINRDVFGVPQKPAGNVGYIQEFQKHASEEFTADVTWSWFCNPKKHIYADNGQGGLQEMQQLGCSTNYYERDLKDAKVPVDPEHPTGPKVFPLRVTCGGCGANLRAFANLGNYRK